MLAVKPPGFQIPLDLKEKLAGNQVFGDGQVALKDIHDDRAVALVGTDQPGTGLHGTKAFVGGELFLRQMGPGDFAEFAVDVRKIITIVLSACPKANPPAPGNMMSLGGLAWSCGCKGTFSKGQRGETHMVCLGAGGKECLILSPNSPFM